ncbi:MAG: hybrid sensor histidine kinase/response regulator [Desulfobacterales bacterium]
METDPHTTDDKDRVRILEIQVKHLRNELRLTRSEYEGLIKNYFDIFSNMEKMVEERTRELEKVKSQLEGKSQELQIMLDASPALIFFKDTEGRYIRVNRKFADFLDIPVERIVGKTHRQLLPDSPAPPFNDDEEIILAQKPILRRYSRIDTPSGCKPMLTDKIPYKDPDGKVIGIIGFATDMTEYEKIQGEKLELQEKLNRSQKMESLGLLAGGVAHDLNNVLTGTVSYPEYLLMELPADSPLREPIRIIQESGQKAAAIVEDLLTLARRGVTQTRVVDLNTIVMDFLDSPEFRKMKTDYPAVHVRSELPDTLMHIKGSEVHLKKTVMNLVANAFEAQPDGGGIDVSTSNRYIDEPFKGYDEVREGDYVVLSVQDRGIGIAPQDLNRIFEPFYTKKVMGRSGTGLGMAVVWGTVQDHKGYIHVESKEGTGTIFQLFFPATREKPSRIKAPIPIESYMGSGETVLVVDDVPEQRQIATSLLGRLNYKVITVSSGEEAVELLRNRPVDLVVLDMIMEPGIDGLETYRRILELRPGQRAVIASGYSETGRVKEAQRLGAGVYVKKPYLLENIGTAVRNELTGKRAD